MKLTYTVGEVAELLGISDDLVYRFIADGVLPAIHAGRRKVVPVAAIDLLLERAMSGFDPDVLLSRLTPAIASSTAATGVSADAQDEPVDGAIAGVGPHDAADRLGEVPASNVGQTGPALGLVRAASPNTQTARTRTHAASRS